MKKLLVLTLALVSANSFALTTRLDFQVRSSGPDAFPCNAGIRHVMHGTARYGATGTNCVGGDCTPGFETETGTLAGGITALDNNSNYGLYLPDLMKGHIAIYNPNSQGEGMLLPTAFTLKGDNSYNFSQLINASLADLSKLSGDLHRVTEEGVRKNKVLTDLTFLFASEQYGTEFFVDVCNYFPELYCDGGDCDISYNDMAGAAPSSWWDHLSAWLVSKKEGTLDYVALSDLKVSVQTYCDGEAFGSVQEPTAVGYVSMIMGSLGYVPPKKCVTRFSFSETNTSKMRLNQTQNSCFEVGTQVDESKATDSVVF